jgi:uncharacterized protein YecE (DUF72 family)
LFACTSSDESVLEAQRKKPQLPYHCHALTKTPILRFIGQPRHEANDVFFSEWIENITRWINEGRRPFVFVHLPTYDDAPVFARYLHEKMQQTLNLPELNANPQTIGVAPTNVPQMGLF